ncbi:hypothetical protein ACOMCU_01180 [Lysinibacillus sp. UGB7]|uniref:hypothetical protein n=1 Tax=Lysinibacillus sp. UGB7 TaxID=3411039 RepID=UPI003B810150
MNEKMHVDLIKCYALVDQVTLFEKVIEDKLAAAELLNAFYAIEKKYETPLLILYLNQIDYYACERILAAIANKLEDYFRQALNHSGLIIRSEQAQRLLFSITDKHSNRKIIRFSMTEKKFAITHTYPKNQADYDAKKERCSNDHLQKENYYNDSIDYLKKWIRDYEETPYNHFSEVKRTYKKLGTLAAVKTFFRKERTFANNVEQYESNNRLLEIMVERLANLLAEQNLITDLDNDFKFIQNLRPGINKSFFLHGYEEVDYKKMYKN